MTQDKDFLKPRKGEVNALEKKRLVKEALDRRLSATHQYYYFSMTSAKARWKSGGGIASGNFAGQRKAFTHVRFHKAPPENYPDAKYIGRTLIHDKNFELFSGITEGMFEAGILYREAKTDETFAPPDPTPLYETEIGERIPFEGDDE